MTANQTWYLIEHGSLKWSLGDIRQIGTGPRPAMRTIQNPEVDVNVVSSCPLAVRLLRALICPLSISVNSVLRILVKSNNIRITLQRTRDGWTVVHQMSCGL